MISKEKLKDVDSKEKLPYKEIPCTHEKDAPEFEKIDCAKCTFDKREQWLTDKLKEMKDSDTIKTKIDDSVVTKTINKVTVVRGKFGDVVGIKTEWT